MHTTIREMTRDLHFSRELPSRVYYRKALSASEELAAFATEVLSVTELARCLRADNPTAELIEAYAGWADTLVPVVKHDPAPLLAALKQMEGQS